MDLLALPVTFKATVQETYLDEMGHMNVMWYTHLFDRATWHLFANLGMDMLYFDREQAGAFALEQHTRYLAEVCLQEEVILRSRILGRSLKRIHFMHFMTAGEEEILAATTELVGSHVDRRTRRSSPFPGYILTEINRLLEEHQRLNWEPPRCGTMSA